MGDASLELGSISGELTPDRTLLLALGWCDSHPFLPSYLSAGDIEKLLGRFVETSSATTKTTTTTKKGDSKKAAAAAAAAAAATEVMILSGTFIVRASFVDDTAQSLQDWAVNRGKEVATLRKSSPKTKPVDAGEKDDKTSKKKSASANIDEDNDEDNDEDKDKDKKKRRSAKKKKGSSNSAEAKGGRTESSASRGAGGTKGGEEDGLKVRSDGVRLVCFLLIEGLLFFFYPPLPALV